MREVRGSSPFMSTKNLLFEVFIEFDILGGLRMKNRKLIDFILLFSLSFSQCFGRESFVQKSMRAQKPKVGMSSVHGKLSRKYRLLNKSCNRNFFDFLRDNCYFGIPLLSVPAVYGMYKMIDSLSECQKPVKNQNSKNENYKKYIPAKFVRKQEDTYWCFVACLQALLKFNGIEISQREVFQKISAFSDTVMAYNGFYILNLLSKDFLNHLNTLMNSGTSVVFTLLTGVYPGQVHLINNVLLDFYSKVNKTVFIITDSSYSFEHAVLVREIFKGEITIEDPWTGQAYKQNFDVYCSQYRPNGGSIDVGMLGVIESHDSPDPIYCAPNHKNKA